MTNLRLLRKTLMAIPVLLALADGGGSGTVGAASSTESDDSLSPRVMRAIHQHGPEDEIPVVVTTAGTAGDEDETEARSLGATVRKRYKHLDGYAASVPAGALRHLAQSRRVLRISYDQEVRVANDINFVTVGADLAFGNFGLDGEGVTVAVLDSGIANHPDIGNRQLAEVEIVGHEKGFADSFGHGTHVAGIIAGDGTASDAGHSFRTFQGIAPRANLVSVRVLGENGSGSMSDVLAGIDWVIANQSLYRIRVLNISLGQPIEQSSATDPLCQAVEKVWKAGIVVVVSAGNNGELGYGTINSPGNDPYVITVGASNNYLSAIRSDDLTTTYSSRGPTALDHFVKPDLLAPGNRTISLRASGSALDSRHPELRVKVGEFEDDPGNADADSPYFRLSGSSMATAVVSGMAALMIQAEPSITPDTVKARLMKSAQKHLEYNIFTEGAGFADLATALGVGGITTVPALSPLAVWTSNGIRIQSTGELWQDEAVWEDAAIWGDSILRDSDEVYADSIVWGGNRTISADTIVWGGNGKISGKSIVWGGNQKLSSDSIVWGGNQKVSAESIVWGGNITADSIVWGGNNTISADSIVWGGNNNPPIYDP